MNLQLKQVLKKLYDSTVKFLCLKNPMCSSIDEHVGPSAQDSEKEVPSVTQIEAQIHGRRKQSIFRCTFGRMLKPSLQKNSDVSIAQCGTTTIRLESYPGYGQGEVKEDLQRHSCRSVLQETRRTSGRPQTANGHCSLGQECDKASVSGFLTTSHFKLNVRSAFVVLEAEKSGLQT